MDLNPYASPRDLAPPPPQPNRSVSPPNRLRKFGVACGLMCTAVFFSLMLYLWRNDNSAQLDDFGFQYVVLASVAITFVGGIVSLVTIFLGNAASKHQSQAATNGSMAHASVVVPYGCWIAVGIVVAVLCLLGWLVWRDPLAVPPG